MLEVLRKKKYEILFNETIGATPKFWEPFCYRIQSDGASEDVAWLGSHPAVGEFMGEYEVIRTMGNYSFTLRNTRYGTAILLGDTPGRTRGQQALDAIPRQQADAMTSKWRERFTTLLTGGTAAACFTTSNFFATSHTIGSFTSYSNLLTGSGIADLTQIQTDIDAARAALLKTKHDNNVDYFNMSLGRLTVLCPVALESAFLQLSKSGYISATENVVYKGMFDVLALPELDATDAKDWYLVAPGGTSKMPFILSVVQEPISGTFIKANSFPQQTVFASYCDFGFGYGDPRTIIKVNNS